MRPSLFKAMATSRPFREDLASAAAIILNLHPASTRILVNREFQHRRSIVYKYKKIPWHNRHPRAKKSAVLGSNIKSLTDARFEPARVFSGTAGGVWKFLKSAIIGFGVLRMYVGVLADITGWEIDAGNQGDDGVDGVEV